MPPVILITADDAYKVITSYYENKSVWLVAVGEQQFLENKDYQIVSPI